MAVWQKVDIYLIAWLYSTIQLRLSPWNAIFNSLDIKINCTYVAYDGYSDTGRHFKTKQRKNNVKYLFFKECCLMGSYNITDAIDTRNTRHTIGYCRTLERLIISFFIYLFIRNIYIYIYRSLSCFFTDVYDV